MGTAEAMRLARFQSIQEGRNANPSILIGWFDDLGTGNESFSFLSNFSDAHEPFSIPGITLPGLTGEHVFQAFKAVFEEDFVAILSAVDGEGKPDPAKAKHLGRTIQLRDDWDSVRFDVMAMVVRLKFAQGSRMAKLLLDTGDAFLQEGTWWQDEVWGVDLAAGLPGDHPGRNWLGTLLMARRAELRAGLPQFPPTEKWNLLYADLAFNLSDELRAAF